MPARTLFSGSPHLQIRDEVGPEAEGIGRITQALMQLPGQEAAADESRRRTLFRENMQQEQLGLAQDQFALNNLKSQLAALPMTGDTVFGRSGGGGGGRGGAGGIKFSAFNPSVEALRLGGTQDPGLITIDKRNVAGDALSQHINDSVMKRLAQRRVATSQGQLTFDQALTDIQKEMATGETIRVPPEVAVRMGLMTNEQAIATVQKQQNDFLNLQKVAIEQRHAAKQHADRLNAMTGTGVNPPVNQHQGSAQQLVNEMRELTGAGPLFNRTQSPRFAPVQPDPTRQSGGTGATRTTGANAAASQADAASVTANLASLATGGGTSAGASQAQSHTVTPNSNPQVTKDNPPRLFPGQTPEHVSKERMLGRELAAFIGGDKPTPPPKVDEIRTMETNPRATAPTGPQVPESLASVPFADTAFGLGQDLARTNFLPEPFASMVDDIKTATGKTVDTARRGHDAITAAHRTARGMAGDVIDTARRGANVLFGDTPEPAPAPRIERAPRGPVGNRGDEGVSRFRQIRLEHELSQARTPQERAAIMDAAAKRGDLITENPLVTESRQLFTPEATRRDPNQKGPAIDLLERLEAGQDVPGIENSHVAMRLMQHLMKLHAQGADMGVVMAQQMESADPESLDALLDINEYLQANKL